MLTDAQNTLRNPLKSHPFLISHEQL